MKRTNFRVIGKRAGLAVVWLLIALAALAPEGKAAGPQQGGSADVKWEDLSPEQKMQRRFPQPARVGDLIGLPVLDENDSTIGRIRQVIRTPAGKIQLIVPYGGLFGWGSRAVAVPIETVGILGRQVAVLEFDRKAFDAAPTWNDSGGQPLAANDSIMIALHRR